ncbi:MAG: NADH-quinone oxidoreductase subunit H [Lentisphaeria bacterium]|nr:NADH-quinone oxidoreductase subunit H [Lentisphaeria bacterium]
MEFLHSLIESPVWRCVLALLLAPTLGTLLCGVDRKLTARMQGRVGPSFWQPVYDLFKLFGKQPMMIHRIQIMYAILHLFFLMLVVVLLVLGQDLLMILFCQAFSALCLVIAAMSVRSPYSWIGSQRKILQMLAYEPTLVLLILAVYLRTDSFMGCKVLESGTPLIYSMPLLFVSLLCVICIEFEKSPFDVASSHHAHQEIVKGTMLEFSGPFLGLIELAHAYELAIFFGLMVAFWHTSLIMGIVLAFFGFLMVLVADNVCARLTSFWMVRFMWTIPLTLSLANLVWLWRK